MNLGESFPPKGSRIARTDILAERYEPGKYALLMPQGQKFSY